MPVQENIGGNTTKHLPCVVPPVVADGGIVPVWFTGWALDGCTTIHKIFLYSSIFSQDKWKKLKKDKLGSFNLRTYTD